MGVIAEADFDSDRSICHSTETRTCWTDVKIQKVALYALSAVCLFAAACMPVSYSPIAAGLALTSLFLAIYSQSLLDYRDPATLEKIRSEALKMSLLEIVKSYGWQQLFVHALLDKEAFEIAFRSYADTLSFDCIVAFYRDTSEHLALAIKQGASSNYTIPNPSEWKGRFHKETEELRIDAIVERYSLSELNAFGLFSTDEAALFDEVKRAIAFIQKESVEIHEEFALRTSADSAALLSAIELAEQAYAQHPAHRLLKQMRSYFCFHCGAFNYQYYTLIRDLEHSLIDAEKTREKAIAAAQEQYRLAVLPLKKEMEALLLVSKEKHEEKMIHFNYQYRAIRATLSSQ